MFGLKRDAPDALHHLHLKVQPRLRDLGQAMNSIRSEFKIGQWKEQLGLAGASICLLVLLSCGSGEIQNFEGIALQSEVRLDRLDLKIYLLDRNGIPLIWNQSILSPNVGISTISEADFTTNAKVYSLRNGQKHKKVYDGRLLDVRWSQELNRLDRLLSAEIPLRFIEEDAERDTYLGMITVEIQTEKQGPFSDTLEKAAIYKY